MAKKKAVKKKKIKKVKKYNLDARIKNALRRVWLWSPMRREVVKRCKVDANTSRCEKCRRLCERVQVDHINPVTELTGWDGNWTTYIARMMIDPLTGLRGLCSDCHGKITADQNIIRRKHKDDNKL